MRHFDNKEFPENPLLDLQSIKQVNIRRLFDLIMGSGSTTRALLARETKLTPTTVSALVDELVRMGYVRQTGMGDSPTGRKPVLFEIDPSGLQVPVISFRPTGIQYILYDLAFEPLETLFAPFPKELLPAQVISDSPVHYRSIDGQIYVDMVEDLIRHQAKALDPSRTRALCLAFAGTFSWEEDNFSSSVLQIKAPASFIEVIRDRLNMPLLVGNVSASLAYAERSCCEHAINDFMYINIGFGVGAGIIFGGRLFAGASGLAGEIGHISINYDGRPCFCGNRGCLERYVNQNAVIDAAVRELRAGVQSVLSALCTGDEGAISLLILCTAAERGDELALRVLKTTAQRLAMGISNAVSALGCYIVVLGGGIEQLGDVFLDLLREEIAVSGFRKVMNKVQIRYATPRHDAESLGIAKYYVDNVFAGFE